eukprot:9239560-Ditylum_brightwellii.AAC.1
MREVKVPLDVKDKMNTIPQIVDILEGRDAVVLDSKGTKEKLHSFIITSSDHLSHKGNALKAACKIFLAYTDTRIPKSQNGARNFIKQFWYFFHNNPGFEDTLLCGVLKNAMHRIESKRTTYLTDATCNLFLLLHQKVQGAANIASAILFGPNTRNIRKIKKLTQDNTTLAYLV